MNTESFVSKSSLNATKIQDNRPTEIQVKSLKRTTTHKFKRYCLFDVDLLLAIIMF